MEAALTGQATISKLWKQRPLIISGPCSAETEEQVLQSATALAATGSRSLIADGIEHGHRLLRETEEHVVRFTKAMIDPKLKTVCIVCRRPALGKVILRITTKVRRWRVGFKEILHRRKNKCLRNLETGSSYCLILLLGRVHRQRISGRIATERIANEAGANLSR